MTVQVADSLVSVVKMAGVLEDCATEEQHSVFFFFSVGKWTQCKGYRKEMFLFTMEVFVA
jgi:hypothetical protein